MLGLCMSISINTTLTYKSFHRNGSMTDVLSVALAGCEGCILISVFGPLVKIHQEEHIKEQNWTLSKSFIVGFDRSSKFGRGHKSHSIEPHHQDLVLISRLVTHLNVLEKECVCVAASVQESTHILHGRCSSLQLERFLVTISAWERIGSRFYSSTSRLSYPMANGMSKVGRCLAQNLYHR